MDQEYPKVSSALLLTDMVGFTEKTAKMNPIEMRDFIVEYRKNLEHIIKKGEDGPQFFEHVAGDATTSVFDRIGSEGEGDKNVRALRSALRIVSEIQNNMIPSTRIGLYAGHVIEARFNDQVMRFGNSFSAASRLQELCSYFGVCLLMDREIACAQKDEKKYVTAIGKIWPKGLEHPVHIFTIYKPGIHGCPYNVDKEKLYKYISLKNGAIELFHGNNLIHVKPDFQKAEKKLHQAASLFKEITGQHDLSTNRVLTYIRELTFPISEFYSKGMKFDEKQGIGHFGVKLFRLSGELLKSLDQDFYNTFLLNNEWESCFHLEWWEKGEIIVEKGAEPTGVYFITKGEVNILDSDNEVIAVIKEGDVFGEIAYFTPEGKRTATAVASADTILNRISGEDFQKFPALRNLFERIAQKRMSHCTI
jgi:class 3 adenylate cyclase